MVKISIKKDKKAIKGKPKPRQKQKQKQSQKVVVNIGSSYRPKRRTTGQALEKNKVVNKSSTAPTPTINVPQANPLYKQPESQAVLGELLKYLKETGVKEKEKNNELEKDKVKENKATIPIDEEIAQVQFTTINSQNISALSSGLATPQFNPLSTPLNYMSLHNALGALVQQADLEGENPNTGRISLSTFNNPNSSSSTSIIPAPDYIDEDYSTISNRSIPSYDSIPLTHIENQSTLTQYLSNKPQAEPDQEAVITEPQLETIITQPQQELVQPETQGAPLEIITNEPAQQDAIIIDTPEPERAVYEEAEEAINMMSQALKQTKQDESKRAEEPTKKTKSKPAEEPPPMIEIKRVDGPAQTTPYTKDQIKKMRLQKVGEIITAEKIKDKKGNVLLFNGGRIFPEGSLKDEVELPEVKKLIYSHYGLKD